MRPAALIGRWWWAVAGLIVALPAIAALIALFRPQWYPAGDMAQAELHVRGLWSHPPLTGAAGRIQSVSGEQGSHPGPSLWIAMYPVYLLFGRSSFGLMAAAASVHIVAIAAALAVARRRGGWSLAVLIGIVCLLVARATGPVFWTEPWNPWLAVFPFLLFVLLIWSVVEGDLWLAPFAILVGSHCIQCHVGYAILVTGLVGIAFVAVVVRAVRDPAQRRRTSIVVGVAAGAGLVIWLPPLIDQIRNDPGNFRIIYQNFSNPADAVIPLGDALRVIVDQLDIVGPWLTGRTSVAPTWVGTLVTFALWAGAVWSARRRRAAAELRMHGVLAATVVLGAFSTSRLFGTYFEYTVRWWWAIAALVVAGIAHSSWRWLGVRSGAWVRDQGRVLRVVSGVVVAALVLVTTTQFATRAVTPGARESTLIAGLAPQLRTALSPDEQYFLRWLDPRTLGACAFGIVLEMERDDIDVRLGSGFSAGVLPHRVMREEDADAVLYLVLGPQAIALSADPTLVMVAQFDPRTADQRTMTDQLTDELSQALRDIGRDDLIDVLDDNNGLARFTFGFESVTPEVLELAAELSALPQPGAVFALAPGQPSPTA